MESQLPREKFSGVSSAEDSEEVLLADAEERRLLFNNLENSDQGMSMKLEFLGVVIEGSSLIKLGTVLMCWRRV